MTDAESNDSRRRRTQFVREISLGSLMSIGSIISATVGVTLYTSAIKADTQVNGSRITALERAREQDRAEINDRLARMEGLLIQALSAEKGKR